MYAIAGGDDAQPENRAAKMEMKMKMYVKGLVLGMVLFLAATEQASADPLMRYSYLDLGYRWLEVDPSGYGGSSSDDLTAAISVSPVEHFALEGGYGFGNLDYGAYRNTFTYGVLGYVSLADSLDLYAHGGGISTELTTDFYDQDGEGVYAGLGLRGLFAKNWEGSGEVQFTDALQQQWQAVGTVLARVHDHIAVKGQATINDNGNAGMLIGVRFTP